MQPVRYPRNGVGEEPVVVFSAWQWALLFALSLQYSVLSFLAPNLNLKPWQFSQLVSITALVATPSLFILPFLLKGGSLARVVKDRIAEPAPKSHLVLGIAPSLCLVLASCIQATYFRRPFLHTAPSIHQIFFGHGHLSPWNFIVLILSVAESLGLVYMVLLMLAVPKTAERFRLFLTYFVVEVLIGLMGALIRQSMYGIDWVYNFPLQSSLIFWTLNSILDILTPLSLLWVLDRISFPSFRPLVFYALFNLIPTYLFEATSQWFSLGCRVTILAVTIIGANYFEPGVLKWPWKEAQEESLELQT